MKLTIQNLIQFTSVHNHVSIFLSFCVAAAAAAATIILNTKGYFISDNIIIIEIRSTKWKSIPCRLLSIHTTQYIQFEYCITFRMRVRKIFIRLFFPLLFIRFFLHFFHLHRVLHDKITKKTTKLLIAVITKL